MKYGSFTNLMYARTASPVPEIGMGATEILWSDRHPYTIIGIEKGGKVLVLQSDIATRTDDNGMSDSQSYSYQRDTEGVIVRVSKRKNGNWIQVGQNMNTGIKYLIGRREEYYDYTF